MTKIKRRDFLKLAFLIIADGSMVAGGYLLAHSETSQLIRMILNKGMWIRLPSNRTKWHNE